MFKATWSTEVWSIEYGVYSNIECGGMEYGVHTSTWRIEVWSTWSILTETRRALKQFQLGPGEAQREGEGGWEDVWWAVGGAQSWRGGE